jgi:hypothetical protein
MMIQLCLQFFVLTDCNLGLLWEINGLNDLLDYMIALDYAFIRINYYRMEKIFMIFMVLYAG